jgi:cytidylate kinase
MKTKMIITIDGPAGAGKSTVARELAGKLGYIYLDTGALYRALAYKFLKDGIDINNYVMLEKACLDTSVVLRNFDGQLKVYVDGDDVGKKIRSEEVGLMASKISALAVVRRSLLHLQREVAAQGGVVAEGRDMASVVFPDADHKFYLDAHINERTQRRHKELLSKGVATEPKRIQEDMLTRDKQDSQREIAPLKSTADAIIIDSTGLSVAEVVEKIVGKVAPEGHQ